jgi:hypothetical protein
LVNLVTNLMVLNISLGCSLCLIPEKQSNNLLLLLLKALFFVDKGAKSGVLKTTIFWLLPLYNVFHEQH